MRQPRDRKLAKTIALGSNQIHENTRLLIVRKNVEKVYGFTQKTEKQAFKPQPKNQETITDYLRP